MEEPAASALGGPRPLGEGKSATGHDVVSLNVETPGQRRVSGGGRPSAHLGIRVQQLLHAASSSAAASVPAGHGTDRVPAAGGQLRAVVGQLAGHDVGREPQVERNRCGDARKAARTASRQQRKVEEEPTQRPSRPPPAASDAASRRRKPAQRSATWRERALKQY
jgi:hypothetical protein